MSAGRSVSPASTPQLDVGLTKSNMVQSPANIENGLNDDMDTPDKISKWFTENDKKNYFSYILGIGRILKTKDQMLTEISAKLKQQVATVNADYDMGIIQVSDSVPGHPSVDKFSMITKAKLKDTLGEDINSSFKTQYYELIQKSIRYDETITKLHGRRDYLVYHMNNPDMGFSVIVSEILNQAKRLYEQYKGMRYKALRNFLFSMIRIVAYSPEIVQKSFILNTSITGPAGSGKTTLARLLAKWYNVLGILTSDVYLDNEDSAYREVGAPEMIAQYVGQTAPKTLGVLYSSLEKTLFIDEAYSVAGCSFDSQGQLQPSPFGEEFISVLLPFIANHQGIGSFIVAGYKNLMEKCFFARNEGLPRRFPTRIDLPLYSTDELYSMFLKNVIDRKEKNISDNDKEKEKKMRSIYRRGRQITYADIKVSFFMLHYDTSYSAIELLRKYLLLIQAKDVKQKSKPITKSATITHHVLTCVLGKQLRRNIIRWYFYKTIFDFNQSNLSFFPAQAGEMGLIADYVNKSIDLKITQETLSNRIKTHIDQREETNLFNEYYKETRGIELDYFEDSSDTFYELRRTGYSSRDFITRISGVLIDTVFKPDNVNPSKPTNNKQRQQGGALRNITRKLRQSGGNLTNLPTLKNLYEFLFDNTLSNQILGKMINLYVEIAKIAIPEILRIPEDKFPVNMTRNEVLVEQLIIDIYDKSGTKDNTELFTSELREFHKSQNREKNLKHLLFQENPGYALWEDLGIDI